MRDALVLGNHRKQKCFLPILDSYFLGFVSLDVKFRRDVVLNVVPVRDDHVSSPTFSQDSERI